MSQHHSPLKSISGTQRKKKASRRERFLRFESLENRRVLATTILDFQEFTSSADQEFPGDYEKDGYRLTTGVSQNDKFRSFGSSSSRYAGSAALSSKWAPTTITLDRPDGEAFSISTIDIGGYLGGYLPFLNFTGTTGSGGTVTQSVQATQYDFVPYELVGMTDLVSLSWAFTGFNDYHQFDNISLSTGESGGDDPTANVDSYSILEGGTLDATWAAPTSSLLEMESDAGDWVGQGDTYFYNDASGDFRMYQTYPQYNNITVDYNDPEHWWSVDLDAPDTDQLEVGVYTNATRYPFQAAGTPGLDVSGDGRGCSQLKGEFEVHAVQYDSSGEPVAIDASFAQSCDNKTEQLRGRVRYVEPGIESGVLVNDTDPQDDPLSAQLLSSTSNGTLDFQIDGTFTYTPDAGFAGVDTFTYTASDGTTTSPVAEVTINVQSTNVAPVAVDDSLITNEDAFKAIDVRTNDTDADNDTLTVTSVSNPPNGTAFVGQSGNVTYVPDADFNGADSFTYTIVDGQGGSDTALVNVTVRPVNDIPVSNNESYSLSEDETLSIIATSGVLANDSDLDGDALTAIIETPPANGQVTLSLNGSFVYTPNADFFGTDSFSYRANDGTASGNVAVVSLDVVGVNDDPNAVDAVFALAENSENGTEVGTIAASDAEGDALAYALSGAQAAAFQINESTGVISVADASLLDFETTADFDFLVEVSDGNGGQATANVHVDLTNVLEVEIDILPDNSSNELSLRSKEIEVAILANTELVPLAMLDLATVRLQVPGSATSAGVKSHRKRGFSYEQRDVNGDGVLDLVLKFKTSDTGLATGDTSLQLEGTLLSEYGGDSFVVEQAVTVVNGGGGGKGKKK
ncbi:MAG: tandem-95 repeat protein [Planctomycetes bacterium]|nr:tandem-95 repeat protein [Planctomycetota bacterium]